MPGIVPVVAASAQPSSSDICDDLVNLSIPKFVIDKFEGGPLEYQAFIATFDELVHSKTSDNQIKLTRLLQYTTGPVKEAIKYCALVGGADGYSQARTILKDRFGINTLCLRRKSMIWNKGNLYLKPINFSRLQLICEQGWQSWRSKAWWLK